MFSPARAQYNGGTASDPERGRSAIAIELCTAVVPGTRFLVQLADQTGGVDMLRKKVLVRVLAGAVLMSGAWGRGVVTAGEAKVLPDDPAVAAPAPAPAEDPAEALKGFKGFLVGELLKAGDEGLVMLVRAATLVEGSTARNPGILLGKETTIEFATEKDAKGRTGPIPWLVKAARRVGKMPVMAFGGLGGDAVVIMDMPRGGEGGQGNAGVVTARAMTMRVNGAEIQLGGGDEEGDEPKRKPQGPTLTARVQAGDDGKLVVDRLMPGSAPGHTWAAMPKLRFAEGGGGVGRVHLGGEAVEVEAVEGMARAAAERARLQALRAQQQAIMAQIGALSQQLKTLKLQLANGGELPPEAAARLERQAAHLWAQIAKQKERLAQLQAQEGAVAKPVPPKRGPDDTDF